MLLDQVLTANAEFVANFTPVTMPGKPHLKLAIVTCMDTRLVDFLEPALGITRGDAKIIKNAGNTITDGNDEVIRSLAVTVFELGVEEIMVIGHTRCGMAHADVEKLREEIIHAGVKPEVLEGFDLGKWLGLFDSEEDNVIKVVEKIRANPLIPDKVPVHGLIIDIDTGKLKVLSEGY